MNTKILSSILLAAFLLVFSISAVSALTFTSTGSQNTTVGIESPNAGSLTLAVENSQNVVFTAANYSGANNRTITVSATINQANLKTGKVYTGNLVVSNGTAGVNATIPITLVKTFCENGSLNASNLDFTVEVSSDGDEDLEWAPLDTISVDVALENNWDNDGKYDLNDVVFEFGLFNSNGTDVTDDLIWVSEDEEAFEYGDIDESENGDHTFEFKIAADLDDGNYNLFVKAYPDSDEDVTCTDSSSDLGSTYFQEISITRDNVDDGNVISFDEISADPSTVSCGQTVSLTAKAYNIGTSKQDAVKIMLYNAALGVDKELVFENFRTTGDKSVDFSFTVPTNISEGTYNLKLWAKHDYNEDDDKDDDVVDFDDSSFGEDTDGETITLKVAGNCVNSTKPASASITDAKFDVETLTAVAGSQLIIDATIKNTGTERTSYTLDVIGNSGWSTVTKIDPSNFTLEAGDSEDVKIYLDVASDAEGQKSFTIRANHGTTYTDFPVAPFNVEKGFTLGKIGEHFKNYWVIYAIVLVNLILIIAIIIIIAKMAR